MKTVAIVLAAGSGKRMGGPIKKQFIELNGKPVLYYSLKAFEDSFIDEIVMVISKEDEAMIRTDIIEKYGISKVTAMVYGGKERYNSVLNGLNEIENADYVFIHDGARPMLDQGILNRGLEAVAKYDACVVGMPSKDTVKLSTEDGMVATTPNRSLVWNIQTPQIFEFDMIKKAYNDVIMREEELKSEGINITDDAMVLETYMPGKAIKLVEGSYSNIKVTTPEDVQMAQLLLKHMGL